MSQKTTPPMTKFSEEDLAKYMKERKPTKFGGCFMCYGLFLKADGTLGCSSQVGYYADLGNIKDLNTAEHINGPLLRYIRESFKAGYEPFSMCSRCVTKSMDYPESDLDDGVTLHIEPSNRCNLWCDVCICTRERNSANTPARVDLDYDAFEKMMRELHEAGVTVNGLSIAGYGEPLFNSDTPRMCMLARSLYPNATITIDTNANFGLKRAKELANCGFSEIRLALDGVDQQSYEGYREGGNFEKALNFSRHLLQNVRETQSPTKVVWKYILFEHNDKDEHLRAAATLANEIGAELVFSKSAGIRASTRSLDEIYALVGDTQTRVNLDMSAHKLVVEQRLAARKSMSEKLKRLGALMGLSRDNTAQQA